MSRPTCAVHDCNEPFSSKGYCKVHAERVRRFGTPLLTGRRSRSLAERLWAYVDRTGGPNACWPFLGCLSNRGYGRIRTGKAGTKIIGAHRAAYLLEYGPEDEPEVIDHLCHNPELCAGGDACPHRRCCNPAHLEASTVVDNSGPDRQRTRRHEKDTCESGHPYTPESTYIHRGSRICRICAADNARLRRARKRHSTVTHNRTAVGK